MRKPLEHCQLCLTDPKVICPRDVDARCLECGLAFCGAHISQHLQKVHFISLSLHHCTEGEPTK